MTGGLPAVTVIVPTLAAPDRAASLARAIASIQNQRGVAAVPLAVVNGPAPDPAILAALEANHGVRVLRSEPAGLPAAIRLGRGAVDTPYFTELDDDDELLSGALEARVAYLTSTPGADVVITNGFRREPGGDVLHCPDFSAVRSDPLAALLGINWLLPGSWLCRTDRIGPDFFDAIPPYCECTYLAVKFSLTGRAGFLDQPTVVWTAFGGLSRSVDFLLHQPAALRRILELDLPDDFRSGFERHLAAAYHGVAEHHRRQGAFAPAWKAHLESLRVTSGWRYLLSTRHLVGDALRKVFDAG